MMQTGWKGAVQAQAVGGGEGGQALWQQSRGQREVSKKEYVSMDGGGSF